MQDAIDMVHHYVKVIREADAALSWTPHLREDDPSWTPEQVQRFLDRYRRRRDTSRYRLRHLLPSIESGSLPSGLAHEDPEVRRILLQELARRCAGGSMTRERSDVLATAGARPAIQQALVLELAP
jgi:DNA-binding transcriptional MocR family regulator